MIVCFYRKKSFTLIELLVVTAIIGILVSLLLPSLQTARYKATIAVCKSNQSQMAKGAYAYSANNSSRWPQRKILNFTYSAPYMLMNAAGANDDRPTFEPYMNLDNSCPFLPEYNSKDNHHSGGYHMTPYRFLFGMPINKNEKAMNFVDQSLYQGSDEFDIIIADKDLTYTSKGTQVSHPDRSPTMMKRYLTVYANWNNGTYQRGKVDMNFTRKDGSTFGLIGLAVNDSRLKKVSYKVSQVSTSNRWSSLPAKK